MLTEKEFKIYCDNIDEGWKYFSSRFYAHNKCVHNPIVYKNRHQRFVLESSIQEHIEAASIYGEFRLISLSALQKARIMVVARLFDKAYFDRERTIPQLGLLYLKVKISTKVIQNKIQGIIDKNIEFQESIQKYRNKRLAHNDPDDISKKIKAGVEIFFKDMLDILKDIKKEYGFEISVPYLEVIDGIAKSGIDEMFKRLI